MQRTSRSLIWLTVIRTRARTGLFIQGAVLAITVIVLTFSACRFIEPQQQSSAHDAPLILESADCACADEGTDCVPDVPVQLMVRSATTEDEVHAGYSLQVQAIALFPDCGAADVTPLATFEAGGIRMGDGETSAGVTVDPDGLVTGITPGDAIKVVATALGMSASAVIRVGNRRVVTLMITADEDSVEVGQKLQLHANATWDNGRTDEIMPDWTSNTSGAMVGDDGLLEVGDEAPSPVQVSATFDGTIATIEIPVTTP
jgi:hypothetical protein